MNLVLECHGEAWKAHDHFGKSLSPAADVPKLTMASFEQDVYFIRQLLLEYTGEGSELDLTAEQAHACFSMAWSESYIDNGHDAPRRG